jgi:VCBS repeat protein
MNRRFGRQWGLVNAIGAVILGCVGVFVTLGLAIGDLNGAANVFVPASKGVAGASGAADPSFAPGGAIPADSLAVADFNGDGRADLGVTKANENNVWFLLGNGGGGFSPATGSPINAGELPVSIATADFNGDRKTDVAVANNRSNDVTVLLGKGAGGFSPAPGSPVKVDGSPSEFATADLNRDGNSDLAVTVFQNGWRLAILLADGSGGFTQAPGSPIALAGREGWQSLATADFNGDSSPDLAVANSELKAISIRLGTGSGGFGAAMTVATRNEVDSFAAVDLNGDGKPDLASASAYRKNVTVLLATGAGGFRAASGSPIVAAGHPHSIVAANFDGDGKPDLAFANETSDVTLLLGSGGGRFRQATFSPFATPGSSSIAGAADLNGDTKPDLMTLSQLGLTIFFQTPAAPAVPRGRALPRRPHAVVSIRGRLIAKLAADGKRAAAMTTLRNGACGRVVVWTAPGRRVSSFRTSDCSRDCARRPRTSLCLPIVCRAGTACVDELALGGQQVAWIVRSGGNSLELTMLAAKLPRGEPKRIETANQAEGGAGGDPNGGHLGQLLGGGPLLAYNSWIVCYPTSPEEHPPCPPLDPATGLGQERLVRVVAGRRKLVKRGPGSYRLVAVGGGRMAVESSGTATVLAPDGARGATIPAVEENPPRVIALSTGRLALERTFTLDLHDPATGAKGRSLALGPAAALELAGVNSKLALLRRPRHLVLVRLSDGKLITLTPPSGATSLIDAKLTGAGLFYAYNTLGRSPTGRIVFEPNGKLLGRF